MVTQDTLRKYAELAVRVGVNVQPGQLMVLASPVDCAFFARGRSGGGPRQLDG